MDGRSGIAIRLLMLCAMLVSTTTAQASRQRHALERYPTDDLTYWSYMPSECGAVAFVSDPDGYLHRVAVGDYMGDAHGRVVAITATRIRLVELFRSDDGEWQERLHLLGPPVNDQGVSDADVSKVFLPRCGASPAVPLVPNRP